MQKKVFTLISMVLLVAAVSKAGSLNRDEIVRDADWSKMKAVTVSMGEFKFEPSRLHFTAGVPYKLTIRNTGEVKHYFVSEGFFKAIALRKVETRDGEIKAPYLTAVEVFPGRSIDLYFVPVSQDTYELTCTIKGHAEMGMAGHVVVE
ncbi:MAG: hypothetical protein GTO08_11945 [Deltaproteobacteria bacterium]|nr:hypothetical protein [Deltaproteobacteria bacterium]